MLHPWGSVDWVGILEAIYNLEQPQEQWLEGVLNAAASLSDRNGGIGGVLYESANESQFQLALIKCVGLSPEWLEFGFELHSDPALAGILARAYRRVMCASSGVFLDGVTRQEEYAHGAMVAVGLEEALCVNGFDSSGVGCALYIFSKTRLELPAAVVRLLQRIAPHLAAAYRLQRRIAAVRPAAPSINAILDEHGRVSRAAGEAKQADARSSPTRAAEQYAWAHGVARREQPVPAFHASQALVAGRWTVREHPDTDGNAYLRAHSNQPPSGPPFLSVRERQVAALAALGRSNKIIAYELGLAQSTVRVLMARAAHKVGVQSRSELIAALAELGLSTAGRLS